MNNYPIIKDGLTFDDVLLEPKYSKIESRSKVDLTVKLGKFSFNHPVIPANMKSIISYEMANEIYLSGGLGLIHRFMPIEDQLAIVQNLYGCYGEKVFKHIGISIGVKANDYTNVDYFIDNGIKIICIDIAHGDSKLAIDMCKYIKKKYPDILLIAGNVATGSGALHLWNAGADVVKVGVGAGAVCSTRINTGCGVPQLSALIDVYNVKMNMHLMSPNDKFIISDGGHRNGSDFVKALCFADMVMAGSVFAGCDETPGNVVQVGTNICKEYAGSSTHKQNRIEGVSSWVPVKGKFVNVLETIKEGIQSGCSYQGVDNVYDLRKHPTFIRITNAGLVESHPHDVQVIK